MDRCPFTNNDVEAEGIFINVRRVVHIAVKAIIHLEPKRDGAVVGIRGIGENIPASGLESRLLSPGDGDAGV